LSGTAKQAELSLLKSDVKAPVKPNSPKGKKDLTEVLTSIAKKPSYNKPLLKAFPPVGTKIKAKHLASTGLAPMNTKWYPGTITKLELSKLIPTASVKYDDGDHEKGVMLKFIKMQ